MDILAKMELQLCYVWPLDIKTW